MKWIRDFIKKVNFVFSLCILFLFYVFILPLGKIIYLVNGLLRHKRLDTYWQTPDKRKLELDSSY